VRCHIALAALFQLFYRPRPNDAGSDHSFHAPDEAGIRQEARKPSFGIKIMGERPQLAIVIEPLLPKDGGGFRLARRPVRASI